MRPRRLRGILKIQLSVRIRTYPAFAKAVESPTNRTGLSVCDDMYLILETITWSQTVHL